MTEQLALVRRADLGSDIEELDLLPWLVVEGWIQAGAGENPVDEVINLRLAGSSGDDLAANLRDLDEMIKRIGWARNPLQPEGVWLRAQMPDETNPRQAFLLAGRRGDAQVMSLMVPFNRLTQYQLGLTRQPLWEALDAENGGIANSSINMTGGTVAYSAGGDAPARVAQITIANTELLNPAVVEIWIGAKSHQIGDPAHLQPVWDLTDADHVSSDTSVSGGDLVCDFSTTSSMARRAVMSVESAAGADAEAQAGRYLVLLQAYTTGSRVVNVRVGAGYVDSPNESFSVGTRQQISNILPALYSLGEVNIPATFLGSYLIAKSAIKIDAELDSTDGGSGTLVMTRLILIPTLDGYVHCTADTGALPGNSMVIYNRPNGTWAGTIVSGTDSIGPVNVDAHGFGLEPDSAGVLVFAGDASGTEVNLTLAFYPRYATLRGAG